MLWLSLYATLHFLSLQMFHKSTCISSGIMFTIMTLSTDSRWINERDLNSIWKSLEISSRSALKYRVKTFMHFLLMKKLCLIREIHLLNDVFVDQMHQPWRTFAALINRSLSGKTSGLDKLRLSRAQIL
ncbi:hypothetical protein Tco_0189536 [Tanacetum coccineum]